MTRSQSLVQAGIDSQDSQAILEAYTAEFGVATLGSSPPKGSHCSETANTETKQRISPVSEAVDPWSNAVARDATPDEARLGPTPEVGDPAHWAGLPTGMALTPPQKQYASPEAPAAEATDGDAGDLTNHAKSTRDEACGSAVPPDSCDVNVVEQSPPRHDVPLLIPAQDGARDALHESIKPPPIAAIAPPRRMALSQQTPTQVNDDRDYSEYCDLVPSSPVNGNTQAASIEPRTLQANESGAVNFGLSELARPSSQVSEDAGFENTRGEWRLPDETPRLNSSHTFTPHRPYGAAFETPALPKNPFAAKGTIAAPLAGSQLFGQTQFSSAVKKISPTSSRPSPNLFNSISPNIIETSPLKNRANVSSPTDIRTSSPQRLHEIPTTSLRDKDGEPQEAETPLNSRSTGGDMIPESPPSSDRTPRANAPKSPPTTSENTGPMAHYEPMKKSQERKTIGEALVPYLESDSDSDDAIRRMERRKRIERRRAQAAEEMGRVSFTPRARRASEEQPSRKKRRVMSSPTDNAAQELARPELGQTKGEDLLPLVDDSQTVVVASNDNLPIASTKATPGEEEPEVEGMDKDGDAIMELDAERPATEEDMIPATSPAPSIPPTAPLDLPPPPSEPELPTLLADNMEFQTQEGKVGDSSSLPLQRRRTTRTYGQAVRQRRRNPFISSSNSDAITVDHERKATPASSPLKDLVPTPVPGETDEQAISSKEEATNEAEKVPQPRVSKRSPKKSRPQLPPPMNTRSRRSEANPATPIATRSVGNIMPTSSSLSILSSTPVPSAKTTPGTQESPVSDRPASVALPSPDGKRGRGLRKRDPQGGAKSESPQPVKRATRMAKRFPRLDSESTDELHLSPSASALEKSIIHNKSSRSFRQSLGTVHRTGRLFESMVFAISFSSQVKPQERTKLETKIAQAGGTILPEGFQDMFEQSSIMNTTSPVIDEEDALKLNKSSSESGFTALVADGHSRKAKYMQALALGLPCLAHQWITACLSKGSIVDWEPYVLCAGVSAVLGNAIRSRTIVPYAAADARLADVIDQRPRLLDGQRILVVVDSRKARNEAKEPYIFLATVLGPSISRVFTIQQAREVLLEHQKAGNPFDWLYIDKGTGTIEAVLAPPEAAGSKKRRRSAAPQQTMGNMRVLDDELVIQSLILGRMVEEDEMHA
ncbi:hypothetical protein G7Z17_g4960 [Cylindrodendrum hubeiense]|uniref:BRCT domain-containing protein n=1 Tax=Cylindrodendrum hubeiense TaxID=595255 RepID=A0A9P5HHZ6_9HYPO|nr:hypothetical protein G7Z17_g4960 [Cylindrodendrum hubeiense]